MPGGPSPKKDLSKRKLLDKERIKRKALELIYAKLNITPDIEEYDLVQEKIQEIMSIVDILVDVIIDALKEDAVVFNAQNGRRFGYIE